MNPISASDIFDASFFKALDDAQGKIKATEADIKNLRNEIAKKNFQDSKDIDDYRGKQEKATIAIVNLNKQKRAEVSLRSLATKELEKERKQHELLNNEYLKGTKRLNDLKKQLKDLEFTGKKNTSTYRELAKEFQVLDNKIRNAEESVGEFQRSVGNYKGELRALQKELAGLEPGSARFNDLAKRAGLLKDRINDAKDATKAFATESKFSTAKTLFGQTFDDIKNADFAGAAEKAKQLSSVVKSITFAEAVGGVKSFGTAMLNLGRSLFANPLFLIVGAITGIAFAIRQKFISAQEAAIESNKKFIEGINDGIKAMEDFAEANNRLNNGLVSLSKARGRSEDLIFKARRKAIADQIDFQYNEQAFLNRSLEALNKKHREATNKEDIKNIEDQIDKIHEKKKDQQKVFFDLGIEQELLYAEEAAAREAKKKDETKKSKETVKENKEQIDKQLFDWEEYYNDLEQLQINNLEDSQYKQERQVELDFNRQVQAILRQFKLNDSLVKKGDAEEIARKKALDDEIIELEKARQKRIAEIRQGKATVSVVARGVLDEEDYLKRQSQKELEKQRFQERINYAQKTLDLIEKELERESQLRREALDKQLSDRQKNIDSQERLAERGLNNTLAFEKQRLAEEQLQKKQAEEAAERQQRASKFASAFLSALDARYKESSSNPDRYPADQVLSKALRDMVTAKGLEAAVRFAFKDGVEDLDGPGTETSDSILARLSKHESVITAEGTKENPGLPTAMNEGRVGDYFAKEYLPKYMVETGINTGSIASNMGNSVLVHQLAGVRNEISELKKILASRPVSQSSMDNFGNIINKEIKNGVTTTIKIIKARPRI